MILAAEYTPSPLRLMLGLARESGIGSPESAPIPDFFCRESGMPGIGEGIPDSRCGRETGNPRFPIRPGTGTGVPIRRAGDFLVCGTRRTCHYATSVVTRRRGPIALLLVQVAWRVAVTCTFEPSTNCHWQWLSPSREYQVKSGSRDHLARTTRLRAAPQPGGGRDRGTAQRLSLPFLADLCPSRGPQRESPAL